MSGRDVMKGFPELMTVSKALEKLFQELKPLNLDVEECPLIESLGRVTAEDVVSPFDLPAFDRAAMDGYAIDAADSFGASPTNPIQLKVVGILEAGVSPDLVPTIIQGQAVLAFTGAPIPKGANAVVPVEHCTQDGDYVQVRKQVHPFQNVSRKGEDYAKGEVIIRKNKRLKPWYIAALASIGKSSVAVYRRLVIGVLSTGSELVELGQRAGAGQIVNSSKPMLIAMIRNEGCEGLDLGTVPDDEEIIREQLALGLEKCDIVLTTGGSSVGEKDLVPKAISLFPEHSFIAHGLRIRPGKPTGVALIRNKPIFILSGFPVATLTAFESLVRPTINYLQGTIIEPHPVIRGRITRRVSNHAGTKSFVRVRVHSTEEGYEVEPLMLTGSGLLSTLTKANGLLVMDESTEGFDEGQEVNVQLIDTIS